MPSSLKTEWTLIRVVPMPYIQGSVAIRAITYAGPAEGRPPTASELAGIWLSPAPLVGFGSDGTCVIDNHGSLDTDPAVRGTHVVDGDTITHDRGGQACTPQDSFA